MRKHHPVQKAILILLLASGALFCQDNSGKKPPRAVKGVLDLRGWNFNKDGTALLDGEWEFYWKQFPRPEDFASAQPPRTTGFLKAPGYWNGRTVNGTKLDADGHGAYRLTIHLDPLADQLAIRMPDMYSAYRLYVNGSLLSENGRPAAAAGDEQPAWASRIVLLPRAERLEFLLCISNHSHHRGGLANSITLGLREQVNEMRERRIAFDLFLFGSLFIMALYHFGLFILRGKDRSPLHFGLYCLCIAVLTLLWGERYLFHLLDCRGWEFLLKLMYAGIYLSVPTFALYMHHLFPDDFCKPLRLVFVVPGTLLTVLVLFAPARAYTRALDVYQFFIMALGLYVIVLLIVAIKREREGAVAFLVGALLMFVTVVNDLLMDNLLIVSVEMIPLGLFLFIFSQAFLLSLRFSKSFQTVENLTLELEHKNEHLEELVNERTAELNGALESLQKKDKRLQYELDMACNIQQGILPETPVRIGRLEIVSYYQSMGKVGGDFFDFFPMPDGCIGVLIGDVSGHGIPAALVTTMAKIAFHDVTSRLVSPREIFIGANDIIFRSVKTRDYLTAFLLVFDVDYRMCFSAAGHLPALLLRAEDGSISQLHSGGFFIGALEEAGSMYREQSVQVQSGDRILLLTDGLTEACNPEKDLYGFEQLVEVFHQCRDLSLLEMRARILDDWQAFIKSEPISDDVTFLLIEVA